MKSMDYYVIDSSSLIELNRRYPIDIFPGLWNKVDELINNYKNFVTPIMMLLIFGVYQFIFSIVFLWFSLTIGPIFFIAKKLKFFTIEEVQITKEILRF